MLSERETLPKNCPQPASKLGKQAQTTVLRRKNSRLREKLKMAAINDIATLGRNSQLAANVGKMAGICFATMTPRVRVPPGPPSTTLIPSNLNEN